MVESLPESRCNKEAFDHLTKAFPKVLVLVTKDDCPACSYAEAVVEDAEVDIGKDVATLEVKVSMDDKECKDLLDQLKIDAVPTALYYEQGQEKKRLQFSGDVNKDLAQVKEIGK